MTSTTRDAVADLRRKHKERQAQTARAYRRRHDYPELDPQQRAAVRARILAAARRRRAEGVLLDTLDALVAEAVRRELQTQGIDPADPPPVPEGVEMPGRWLGAKPRGVGARISVLIPRAYAVATIAAAWQISAEHIEALREWDRQHPAWNGFRDSVTPEALAERDRIAEQVVTAGDIYRQALERLTAT